MFTLDSALLHLQKKTHESINNMLALVVKSGKFTLRYETVLKLLRKSEGKLIIIRTIARPLRKSEIEYYTMLSKLNRIAGAEEIDRNGDLAPSPVPVTPSSTAVAGSPFSTISILRLHGSLLHHRFCFLPRFYPNFKTPLLKPFLLKPSASTISSLFPERSLLFIFPLSQICYSCCSQFEFAGAIDVVAIHPVKLFCSRYETKGEGFKAIKMWNSATIRDHKLLVKFARFSERKGQSTHVDKGKRNVQDQNHPTKPRFAETSSQGGERQQKSLEYRVVEGRSYAQVLKGLENQDMQGKKLSIQNGTETNRAVEDQLSHAPMAAELQIGNSEEDTNHQVQDNGEIAQVKVLEKEIPPLHGPVVLDSQDSIRASQIDGINLFVQLKPSDQRRRLRRKIYDECMSHSESEFISDSLISRGQRQKIDLINGELQSTLMVGKTLGVDLEEDDVLNMKKMIETEAKESIIRQRSSSAG
ncbi:hypothetical protein Vadar_029616 [Vaccinium darrowii]|uniref:Uncharacterized protein n=1 Tax=Vaccinium darrowii TaxID=229202 RepID=A0ACB7X4Q5_9ERIC|nr:hypothetical protein Vadar_029616 [Vaccinium darrowii]